MAVKTRHHAAAKDDYLNLVIAFPLKAIHNDEQLKQAIKVIDRLTTIREDKLTAGQADYLEALSELVHCYEQAHHAVDTTAVSGLETLSFLLEQNDMSASDLGRLLGNRSLGSKILRGERELSKTHIGVLSNRFKVSSSVFLSR